MANTWFQFKQFKVHQQQSAMKVSTDSCLFGSLQPQFQPSEGIKILDIGTGTGLLSLMVAQYNPDAMITAIEIDGAAAAEAAENIAASPFSRHINVVVSNIMDVNPVPTYHHILCNPPFYENQLASPKKEKNIAHHAHSLTMEMLIPQIKKWLLPTGTASLLIPFYRENEVKQLGIAQNLMPVSIIRVKHSPAHRPFRSIIMLSQQPQQDCTETDFMIRDLENQYTPEFTMMLKPFYLNL